MSHRSNPKHYDLIVIGGGAGGLVSSGFAATLGLDVALVSKGPLGGECLWSGCVPSKAFIHAAKIHHTINSAHLYDIPVTEVACSFKAVMQSVKEAIQRIEPHDSPEQMQHVYGVKQIYRGSAAFIDSHTIEVNGERLNADKFILATGAKPVIPPIPGLVDIPYYTHETIFDLTALPPRLAILGGGPVGIELGQAFQRLGSQVVMIDSGPRILSKEEPETSVYVQSFLEAEGLIFYLNTRLAKVSRKDDQLELVLQNNSSEKHLVIDVLLLAVGKQPVTEGLNLEKAGVEYDEKKGIRINAHCQTSAKHIWAVGDVTNRFQFTHYAEHQAKVAVMNACIKLPMKQETGVVPWVTFTDPEVAHVGLTYEQAQSINPAVRRYRYSLSESDRLLIGNKNIKGFLEFILSPSGKIYGATMVGEHAGEIIHQIAMAMRSGRKLQDLSNLIYAYPTVSEAIKNASYHYFKDIGLTGWKERLLLAWVKLLR